jgi:hypothetical protein
MLQWYTVTDLGPKQSLTPEGFLVARDVPVARTGVQLYQRHELPGLNVPGTGAMVAVDREPAEVFDPDSIASAEGKPITNEHPADLVTPDTWSDLAIGTMQNARRGTGDTANLVLADLLFTTRKGIDAVRKGKRALSVGYLADYRPTGLNAARQINIKVNHVALVDAGRCGAACYIGDSRSFQGRKQMSSVRLRTRDLYGEAAMVPEATRNSRSGNYGAQRSNGEVGGELVMRLPGELTAYYIDRCDDGAPGLFRVTSANGALDPGEVVTGSGSGIIPTRDGVVIAGRDQQRQALRSINEANRKRWP